MEQYIYTVKDQRGKTKSGIIEAIDQRQASNMLHDRGLVVIKLESKQTGRDLMSLIQSFRGISLSDQANFTRQLSTMVTAGLNLLDALFILEKQASDPHFKEVIESIAKDVQGGASFANALSRHKNVFSPAFINMVRAGEASGTLDQVLNKLAEALERQREFDSKVKGAFIYPIIVIIAMIVVSFVILVFVIPRLTGLYKDLGTQLPLPTLILLQISSVVRYTWWLIIAGMVAGFIFFRRYAKTNVGSRQIDSIVMKIPLMGQISANTSMAVLTRTLGSLVGSGVPIIEALKISANVATNALHRESIVKASQAVEKGAVLSAILSKDPLFPPIVSQMISVGEETGKLDEVLEKLSQYFESEVEQSVKNLTAAIEPVIMVILGLMVAFLVISIILPIYKITSSF